MIQSILCFFGFHGDHARLYGLIVTPMLSYNESIVICNHCRRGVVINI